jgi:hypothetical protein
LVPGFDGGVQVADSADGLLLRRAEPVRPGDQELLVGLLVRVGRGGLLPAGTCQEFGREVAELVPEETVSLA